jgi:hypothetical protein
MAGSGAFSPAAAFDLAPVTCQSTIYSVLYYSPDDGATITGEDVTYCDGHEIFLGSFDIYSWTDYCNPTCR